MKILLSTTLLLLFACGAFAQNSSCPTLQVNGPSRVPKDGEVITFIAKTEGINKEALKYSWSASRGEIKEGQGTESVKVPFEYYFSLTVTVEVEGFPKGCLNIASETLSGGLRDPQARLFYSSGCPKISVETSPVAVIDGYPMTLTAKVNGDDSKLKYKWTVSKSEITEGQGTAEIRVNTLGYAGEEIEATVEVTGLRETCGKTASTKGIVKPKPDMNVSDSCPEVVLTGPSSGIFLRGAQVIYTATVGGVTSDLNFKWTLSDGVISEGQGTPVIKFPAADDLNGKEIKVKLEIDGLSADCKKSYTDALMIVFNPGTPRITDSYGEMPFAKEKERLANVAFELTQEDDKDIVAIFIIGHEEKFIGRKKPGFCDIGFSERKTFDPRKPDQVIFTEANSKTEIYLQPQFFYERLKK